MCGFVCLGRDIPFPPGLPDAFALPRVEVMLYIPVQVCEFNFFLGIGLNGCFNWSDA